jgi:hypothetical protein
MIRIGTTGSAWRGEVTPWGAIVPLTRRGAAAAPTLDWWIGGDDRWYTPAAEVTVRQTRLSGAPVVETRVRVPGGDARQRVYATADDGGLTVMEVVNDSPAPFAVAVSHPGVLASKLPTTYASAADRPVGLPAAVPAAAAFFAVPHRTTLRLALAHDGRVGGPLVASVAGAETVAGGWVAQCRRGWRVDAPLEVAPGWSSLAEAVVTARSVVLLDGPDAATDATEWLLRAAEWVRMGEPAEPLVDAAAEAATRVARAHRRADRTPFAAHAAVAAAAEVLAVAGEALGAADVRAIAARMAPAAPAPASGTLDPAADAGLFCAVVLGAVAGPGERGAIDLVCGFGPTWRGAPVEVHRAPTPAGPISYAIRWHGPRPALLWDAPAAVELTCRSIDPTWRTEAAVGETLLSAPPVPTSGSTSGSGDGSAPVDEPGSFA